MKLRKRKTVVFKISTDKSNDNMETSGELNSAGIEPAGSQQKSLIMSSGGGGADEKVEEPAQEVAEIVGGIEALVVNVEESDDSMVRTNEQAGKFVLDSAEEDYDMPVDEPKEPEQQQQQEQAATETMKEAGATQEEAASEVVVESEQMPTAQEAEQQSEQKVEESAAPKTKESNQEENPMQESAAPVGKAAEQKTEEALIPTAYWNLIYAGT